MLSKKYFDIHPVVFPVASGLIVFFVVMASIFTEAVGEITSAVQDFIVTYFGWFYILVVALFLLFVIYLAFSRYAKVKLGKDDDEPEYSFPTWFAMLFSAGMGIGLLFYGVAEPVMHFSSPPFGLNPENQVAVAKQAMNVTFFHWGLHAWAIYIVIALALAYFAYRHDLPLTIRSTLYPLLGDKINGRIGDFVEVAAIFGTLFGVATSLGLGVKQVNSGLDYLNILEISTQNQLLLIGLITAAATVSVVTGVDGGIRRLSETNLFFGLLLLLFVFFTGPTLFLLSSWVESVGYYFQTLISSTFRTTPFEGVAWQKGWTMFYWGWWISWSPFVGMFIARISRGRTIGEFIAGVLLVPTMLTFLWFVVFGNTALWIEMYGGGGMTEAVSENVSTALFVMLDKLPFSGVSSFLATLIVALFFITSSDSGSLVIDILSSGGNPDPPTAQRVFWSVTEGTVAAILLLLGGLSALQTAAIATALPFAFVMIFICISLYLGLRADMKGEGLVVPTDGVPVDHAHETPILAFSEESGKSNVPWKERLSNVLALSKQQHDKHDTATQEARGKISDFLKTLVIPTFEELSNEVKKGEHEVQIERFPFHATVRVFRENKEIFYYTIRGRVFSKHAFAFPDFKFSEAPKKPRAEIMTRSGLGHVYDLDDFTQAGIIQDFIHEFAKWKGW